MNEFPRGRSEIRLFSVDDKCDDKKCKAMKYDRDCNFLIHLEALVINASVVVSETVAKDYYDFFLCRSLL